MKLGERMQNARQVRGYSQYDFAKLLGIGRSTLANYEQGVREPSLEMIEKIASALCVSPAWLVGWSTNGEDLNPERLRKRRVELGLTQEELAKRMGYASRVSINKFENGRKPSAQTITRLAQCLGVAIEYLIDWSDCDD